MNKKEIIDKNKFKEGSTNMSIGNYKKTGLFFTLSTLLPWTFWFLAAYISHAQPSLKVVSSISSMIAFIGLLIPLAVTILFASKDKRVLEDLSGRIFNFKNLQAKYILLSCFLMLASILVAQAISLLFGYSTGQFKLTFNYSFSSGVFPVWFLLFIAPLVEELAWHTYGTDCLRNKFNLINTSLIFAFYWGIWHLPLSFIKDYYHSNLASEGIIYSINFFVSLFPFVIIMNWIYYKTNRNIILPIVFHITAGYFNEIFATHPISKVIQTVLLSVFSIYILLKNKSFFFDKKIYEDKFTVKPSKQFYKIGIYVSILIGGMFLLAVPSDLKAQKITQTICGKVYDNITNEPLVGASVIILDSDPLIGTATDLNGNFAITRVIVGRYSIHVSMVGYESYIVKELIIGAGQVPNLKIGLNMGNIELEEAVVSISKSTPLNSMATLSARQFTVEETQRFAGGMDDPARLASSFAGVANPSLSQNGISVRGNNPDGLLWRVEGIEVPCPNHFANLTVSGGGLLSVISNQVMGNSDFYTGAFPAEYGNASSGVFDINLREGNRDYTQYALEAGAMGVSAMFQGPLSNNSNLTYIANYRYSTMSLIAPFLPSDAGLLKYQDLSFKINYPTKKYGVISVWGIGAIDGVDMEAADSTEWEANSDRDNSQTSMHMFATALSHKIVLPGKVFLNTTFSASGNGLSFNEDRLDYNLNPRNQSKAKNNQQNFTFQSELSKRFSNIHSNKTGIRYSYLHYNVNVKQSLAEGETLTQIANNSGNTGFLQFFSQSKIQLFSDLSINTGINAQYLLLNKNYSIEPRFGIKYNLNNNHSLGFAFGLHSRLEQLSVYFVSIDGKTPNKNIDFMKSAHYVLSYEGKFSENLLLRIEPYYQKLTNVPVAENSYISTINNNNTLFFDDDVSYNGTGKNYGIDLTLEKYLSNGYYYMLTASIFDSKYTGNDNIERNTRFNRNYIFNIMAGKEWKLDNLNIISANFRLNYLGGSCGEAIDYATSYINKKVEYGETGNETAFNKKYNDLPIFSFTFSYRINWLKSSGVISLQLLNLFATQDYSNDFYNLKTNQIETKYNGNMIPNISFKYEF